MSAPQCFTLSFRRLARRLGLLLGLVALIAAATSSLLVLPAFLFSRLPLSLAMTPLMLLLLPPLLLALGLAPLLLLGGWLACRLFRLELDDDGLVLSMGPYRRETLWLEVRRIRADRVFGLPCAMVEGLGRESAWRIPTGLMHDGERLLPALLAFSASTSLATEEPSA